jgi:aspartate aminotransferase-like enzyme
MEAAVRNLANKDVLVCSVGAFGKKWYDIAKSCGKEVDLLEVQPGKAISASDLQKKLALKKYEIVCITHNETSTGVQNDLSILAPLVKESGSLLCVDAVSSMAGAKIPVDELGADVCITSSQKCFSLPPGLSFASVSESALAKAKTVGGRGFYFDFVELAKEYDSAQTPYTPAVSLIFGLRQRLKEMDAEGLENVWARHVAMADMTQKWANSKGLLLFAAEGCRSVTVTCIENNKKINLEELKKKLKGRGYVFDAGYRKMNENLLAKGKNETFRIPHMGDLKVEELKGYLDAIAEEAGL